MSRVSGGVIDEVNDNKQDSESHWYKASLGKVYIPYTSNKRPDKDFVNAVCKVQSRESHKMSANERNSVKKCLKQPLGAATTTNVKKYLLLNGSSRREMNRERERENLTKSASSRKKRMTMAWTMLLV